MISTVHFGWLGNGRRRHADKSSGRQLWAVDGDFGQWMVTLGWTATLGWTTSSGWSETGWPMTLGSEVEGWRR
jgi:hypothetical protein